MKFINSNYFSKKNTTYLNTIFLKKSVFFDNFNIINLFSKNNIDLYFFIICKNILLYKRLFIKNYRNYLLVNNSYNFFYEKINFLRFAFTVLELKGVNFRFSLLKEKIFLDLGNSHFKFFFFNQKLFFFWLKKKKNKKLLLFSKNSFWFFNLRNFFRFWLRKVGPYKLKGFQFINEFIKLKEGKKPFK